MGANLKYAPPATDSGDLRTPVTFFEYAPNDGPEPGQQQKDVLFECFAEVYSPSQKDLTVLSGSGTTEGATIRIRDTAGEYVPTNKHYVEIEDYRYQDKVFNIVDVRHDMQGNQFTTIVLRYTS